MRGTNHGPVVICLMDKTLNVLHAQCQLNQFVRVVVHVHSMNLVNFVNGKLGLPYNFDQIN